MTVPDGMPTLSPGMHLPGDGAACVMEYVSLLAGEPWSDSPQCTHPILALAARTVNDHLNDDQRALLVPMIGRLFGTSAPRGLVEADRLAAQLAVWAAGQVIHLVQPSSRERALGTLDLACRQLYGPTRLGLGMRYSDEPDSALLSVISALNAASGWLTSERAISFALLALGYDVNFLSRLIDEYDRLTGRTSHRQVTETELRELTRQL